MLRSVPWAAAVFDEAHRLKGINSSTRAAVEELDIDWMLLLTGGLGRGLARERERDAMEMVCNTM